MSFANAIFSAEDVAGFVAANKKLVMEEKKRLLQEWAADALVDGILNPYSVSRVSRDSQVPIDEVKRQLSMGKTDVLLSSFKHAIFKKDSSPPGFDCRSEIYRGKIERNWVVRDRDDRPRPLTVEDAATISQVHEFLSDRRPGFRDASVSVLAVLKHTDFVDQLASRFGDKFTCSWIMEQRGEETQYWTPYVIQLWLEFWPKGVEKSKADKIAKAKRDFDYRSETMIVTRCDTCRKGLTRNSCIHVRCSENCHCIEHDTAFCSDKCMGPFYRRE